MLKGMDVARYLLSRDTSHQLFDKTLCTRNGRKFYVGNARLNKYMHMAQNIYIAKYGKPLMDSVFYAYDNGAVTPQVQENYSVLLDRRDIPVIIGEDEKKFLDCVYKVFQNASLDELIALSHEDPEWIDKHKGYSKEDQKMDSMKRQEEYKNQYADMIKVMERMEHE